VFIKLLFLSKILKTRKVSLTIEENKQAAVWFKLKVVDPCQYMTALAENI
jgi:hypothetical protein